MLPLLRALSGAADALPRTIRSTLAAPLGPGGSRREFLRARWDGETIAAQKPARQRRHVIAGKQQCPD